MVSKTKLGIKEFDTAFGGTYQGRVTLISGPSKTGKTAIALQFLNAGLQQGENVMILSAMPSRDLAILAESMNIDVDVNVESGALTILEYNDFVPGRDAEENIMLPPEGFSQLQAVIENNGINRLVIDTVVPWIAFPGNRHLAEHVFSFVRAFERLGATSLFTAPKPASPTSQRMLKYIVDNVPVAIYLSKAGAGTELQWRTAKYLGETSPDCSFLYILDKGGTLAVVADEAPSPVASPEINHPSPAEERPPALKNPFSQGFPPPSAAHSGRGAGTPGAGKRSPGQGGGRSPERDIGSSAFSSVVWKDGSKAQPGGAGTKYYCEHSSDGEPLFARTSSCSRRLG
jgi:KaiC/GvpD/RAD55 family RecA-like ATPase